MLWWTNLRLQWKIGLGFALALAVVVGVSGFASRPTAVADEPNNTGERALGGMRALPAGATDVEQRLMAARGAVDTAASNTLQTALLVGAGAGVAAGAAASFALARAFTRRTVAASVVLNAPADAGGAPFDRFVQTIARVDLAVAVAAATMPFESAGNADGTCPSPAVTNSRVAKRRRTVGGGNTARCHPQRLLAEPRETTDDAAGPARHPDTAAGQAGFTTNAGTAGAADQPTNSSAEHGTGVVRELVPGAHTIRTVVTRASARVEELGKLGERIGQVVGAIDDVADQTNRLARNAAGGVGGAGEHTKDFAVVAEEIRTLAGRSQRETEIIGDLIENVQTITRDAIEAMGRRATDWTAEAPAPRTATRN